MQLKDTPKNFKDFYDQKHKSKNNNIIIDQHFFFFFFFFFGISKLCIYRFQRIFNVSNFINIQTNIMKTAFKR